MPRLDSAAMLVCTLDPRLDDYIGLIAHDDHNKSSFLLAEGEDYEQVNFQWLVHAQR